MGTEMIVNAALRKRCIAVESQLREVAVGFAKEISKLKVAAQKQVLLHVFKDGYQIEIS